MLKKRSVFCILDMCIVPFLAKQAATTESVISRFLYSRDMAREINKKNPKKHNKYRKEKKEKKREERQKQERKKGKQKMKKHRKRKRRKGRQ